MEPRSILPGSAGSSQDIGPRRQRPTPPGKRSINCSLSLGNAILSHLKLVGPTANRLAPLLRPPAQCMEDTRRLQGRKAWLSYFRQAFGQEGGIPGGKALSFDQARRKLRFPGVLGHAPPALR